MNAMYSLKGRKRSPLTSLEMISDRYAAAGSRGEAVLKEIISGGEREINAKRARRRRRRRRRLT